MKMKHNNILSEIFYIMAIFSSFLNVEIRNMKIKNKINYFETIKRNIETNNQIIKFYQLSDQSSNNNFTNYYKEKVIENGINHLKELTNLIRENSFKNIEGNIKEMLDNVSKSKK